MKFRVNGRIVQASTGEKNKKAAELVLARKLTNISDGKFSQASPNSRAIFSELAEVYLEWAKPQRSIRTKKGFIKALEKAFGRFPLISFTTLDVERFVAAMLASGKKPATVNRHLATLKHMFTKAEEWEMVSEQVLKKVRKVKQLQENNRRLRYLSTQECCDLINACKPHLKPIVITALNAGMRKEEILSLEWDRHVDLKHGFILLDVTKNGERREIPLNRMIRETLQGLVRHLNSPYVFVDRDGKRFKDIKKSFHAACRIAGIKDFRFHDLRHTFASHLIMSGVDITTVKELLGHKSLVMTMRYAHLAPGHKAKAVESLYNRNGYVLATVQKKGATANAVTP